MFRLHFNKHKGSFTIRRADRSTAFGTDPHVKLPLIGDTIALSPNVHIIITRNTFKKAMAKQRPVLNVAVTRFPFVRLLVERIKEVF